MPATPNNLLAHASPLCSKTSPPLSSRFPFNLDVNAIAGSILALLLNEVSSIRVESKAGNPLTTQHDAIAQLHISKPFSEAMQQR
jgi:hypothetical protein